MKKCLMAHNKEQFSHQKVEGEINIPNTESAVKTDVYRANGFAIF